MDFSEEHRWIVKSARTIQGEIVDLGEEEWLESGPPPMCLLSSPLPTWCTWVNVCARVGAPEYIPKKSSPCLSRGSVVGEGAEDPWDLRVEV